MIDDAPDRIRGWVSHRWPSCESTSVDELSEAGRSFNHPVSQRNEPTGSLGSADLQAILDLSGSGKLLVARPNAERLHPIIVWSNDEVRKVTGLRAGDLHGARLRTLRAGDVGDPSFAAMLGALAAGDGWTGDLAVRGENGQEVVMAASMVIMADGLRALLILQRTDASDQGPEFDLPLAARMLGEFIEGGLYRLAADVDGGLKLDWADPAVERLTGYSLPELQARGGLSGLASKRDQARLRRRNLDLMAGVASQIGYAISHADGRRVRLLDQVRPLRGQATPAHHLGASVERAVGRLRLLEPTGEEARAAGSPRADYELLADLLNAAILAIDADLALIWAVGSRKCPFSDAVTAIGSSSLDDVLGKDLIEEWRDWIEHALATRQPVSAHFCWPASGQSWTLDVTPISTIAVLAVVRQRTLQETGLPDPLRHAEPGDPTLELLLEQTSDGVLVLDVAGRIVRVSRAAETIFELAEQSMIGRAFDSLFEPQQPNGPLDTLSERLALQSSGGALPVEVIRKATIDRAWPGSLLIVRDISLRKQTEETIRNLAYSDPLTGLPNRLLFMDRLSQAIERAKRTRQGFAVMVLDLDRFKLINESLGLDKGDRVLCAVATRIGDSLRKSDTVARPGSDEFLILALATEGAEGAGKVAQKTLDSLQAPFQINGDEPSIAVSIGIALFPHDGEEPDQLLKNAGTALARAKNAGSHSYQFYTTDMNAKAYQRLVLESRLRNAIVRGELSLHFQPLIEIAADRVTGLEALLRWNSKDSGMISPGDFIPIAEETGLILPIGEWVLRQAVTQMGEWHGEGLNMLRIAVNISARQFQARDFVVKVRRLLSETGFPGPLLELELTESSIMADVGETVHRLHELAELGVQVTVDDFGTGYSSLAYLKRFPISALKIDRSFIADVTTDPNDAAIARAVVALAATLKVRVVGEGVETREQLAFLRELGCGEAQGYLIGRPMPAADVLPFLRAGTKFW